MFWLDTPNVFFWGADNISNFTSPLFYLEGGVHQTSSRIWTAHSNAKLRTTILIILDSELVNIFNYTGAYPHEFYFFQNNITDTITDINSKSSNFLFLITRQNIITPPVISKIFFSFCMSDDILIGMESYIFRMDWIWLKNYSTYIYWDKHPCCYETLKWKIVLSRFNCLQLWFWNFKLDFLIKNYAEFVSNLNLIGG